MIGTRYATARIGTGYATTRVGFGSGQKTAWQTMKANRARLGAALSVTQANLGAITSAFASAQQDRINGLGILAAKAAIARVQAEAKVKSESVLAQIDNVQKTIDDAKTVGKKTVPEYVSWALTPTVDTTV